MAKKLVTLVDLQYMLSDALLKVNDENSSTEKRAVDMATANCIYAGARNLIHNAATIMRAKEIIAEGKVKDTKAIKALVGDIDQ